MTKLKKIIIISLGILILLGGLEYWHYRKINAFYFSYQNHESMLKQQNSFFKSIREEDLKAVNVNYGIKNVGQAGPRIDSLSFRGKSYVISLIPTLKEIQKSEKESNLIVVSSRNPKIARKDDLCIFNLRTNYTGVNTVNGLDKKNVNKYKKEAVEHYKQTFKKVYDNWEIRYW